MKIICTSLTGSAHQVKNIECQDVVNSYCDDTFSIIVLSDGAGSKPYALESATLLTSETISYFKSFFTSSHIDLFDSEDFINYIQRCFQESGYSPETAGATLIFAVVINNRYLIGHMGDGVALLENNDDFSVISYPENGEYECETFFFPSESAHKHFRTTRGEMGSSGAIILTSDGISDCLYDFNTGRVANAVKLMVEWARDYSEEKCKEVLLNNFRTIFSEYSADDKSVAIICTTE